MEPEPAERPELEVREPDTGRPVGRVPLLGATEVRELVREAREAARSWRERPVRERAEAVDRLRRLLARRSDEVARRVGRETGKSTVDVYLGEILPACGHLAWTASRAPKVLAPRRYRRLGPTHRGRVTSRPYGVAGIVTPWNFPLVIPAGAAGSALAAGNAVVLKPSELTPHTGLLLEELAAEALPDPRLLRAATGDGSTGRALVDAPVDVLSFTGGRETGRRVMEAAARHLTPVVLELGGKDAMIVLADADLERAARGAAWGAFFHAGQVCQSVERAFVHRDVRDEFLERVAAEARRLRVGRRASSPDLGAFTRPAQLEVVEAHVRDALERGARVVTGGRRLPGPGAFYEPTVLADVTPGMRIAREETFGPVLPVLEFVDEEEVVARVNDSPYGLDAYVWTGDRKRGRALGRRLEVGTVMVNDCLTNYGLSDLPFGGVKGSGFGRTHGEEGLRAFTRTRAEAEPRFPRKREPHWFPGPKGTAWLRALVRLQHERGLRRRLGPLLGALRGRGADPSGSAAERREEEATTDRGDATHDSEEEGWS